MKNSNTDTSSPRDVDGRRVAEIFDQACELPGEEVEAFLTEVCGADEALRREVEELLAAHGDAADEEFLGDGTMGQPLFGPEVVAEPVAVPGDQLGAYRLFEKIGQGGMGAVYLAERADGSYEHRVAIKVLRDLGLEDEAHRRLERERQILAHLAHPGIARLLDGGETSSGSPYVVMEHVEGLPIDKYCDAHSLSPTARVDLFLEVCEAVSAAHRALVLHRDLKPSNILVDTAGHPRLLDFGIAKLLDPAGSIDGEGENTATRNRWITPSYASLEQVRGGRMTVAADVYMLGSVLYMLLVGQPPYGTSFRSQAELEKVLEHEIPVVPSAAALEHGRRERIDSDLDHIVLKALRSDPEARYPSVEALATDLRRYRQGLPVEARHGNLRYRVGKFVHRYWAPLATAALFVVVVPGFAIWSSMQASRLARALERSERAEKRSTTVERFLEDIFWQAGPGGSRGGELTVLEALERSSPTLAASFVEQPDIEAALRSLFGRILFDLGRFDLAAQRLEEALALYESIATTEPGIATELLGEHLSARGDLARVRFRSARTQAEQDQAEELAWQVFEEGQAMLEEGDSALLEIYNVASSILCWQKRWLEAAALSEETMALVRRLGDTESAATAEALLDRALVLKNVDGDLEASRALYKEGLRILRKAHGEVHPAVADTVNQLALIAEDRGDFNQAIERYEEALEIRRGLYPRGHWELGAALSNLAGFCRDAGDLEIAEKYLREAVDIYREVRGPTYGRTVALVLSLGETMVMRGAGGEVEALLDAEVFDGYWSQRPEDSRLLNWAKLVRGAALVNQGRHAEARILLEESLPWLEARYAAKVPLAHRWLGRIAESPSSD